MDNKNPRLLIIIPAWNEAASITDVIDKAQQSVPYADILVVNDQSADDTSNVARKAGANVLDLPVNLGVGGAMRAGFVYATRHNYDYAVQVDADGQHNPADIPTLLEQGLAGADIVIGARFAGKGAYQARGPRKWAMSLLAFVMTKYGKNKLTDVTSGFKLYSRRAFSYFADHYPAEYLGDTIEALLTALKAGFHVVQVAVEMHARTAGVPSHSPIKAAIYLFRAMMSLVVAIISPLPKGGK